MLETAQQANEFIAQPINNLLVFLAIVSVCVVLLAGVTVYKFGPVVVGIMKSIAETLAALRNSNDKLVDMKAQALEWDKKHASALEDTNRAVIALDKSVRERSELDGQALDEMRDEVSKSFEGVNTEVQKVWKGVDDVKADIASLQQDIDEKLASILDELQKRGDCSDLASEVRTLREEVRAKLQPTNAVSNVTVNATQPANLIPDDGAKDAAA